MAPNLDQSVSGSQTALSSRSSMALPADIEVGEIAPDDSASEDGLDLSQRRGSQSPTLRSVTQEDIDVDEERVGRAVQESGVFSFGIVGVEAWLFNEEDGVFTCPDGGIWQNPVIKFSPHSVRDLDRIFDPSHPGYLPPEPQIAGTGIAGYFWSVVPPFTGTMPDTLLWRDLKAVTSDPDQPPSPRMQAMVESGIGKAAGAPFNILGKQGIVIYLARSSASVRMLNENANAEYLHYCAQYIGSAASLTIPRQLSLESRRHRVRATFHRIVTKVATMQIFAHLAETVHAHATDHKTHSHHNEDYERGPNKCIEAIKAAYNTAKGGAIAAKDAVVQKATTIAKKSKGSSTQPPPPAPFAQSLLAFIGSLATLSLMYGIAQIFEELTNNQFTIILGPLVSLMCAQYALTAAPASQPRNAVYGQIISCCGAFLCRWLLRDLAGAPDWFQSCTAGALSVFFMAKLGVVHPPAAGAAYFFANSDHAFESFLLVLFGNFVSIGTAIVINNWSDKRQYPVYWKFGFSGVYTWIREKTKKHEIVEETDEGDPSSAFLN